MMRMPDDRAQVASELSGSVGGSLDALYWKVSARCTVTLVDLPDSYAATALAAVLTHTGAYEKVEVEEILTQEQFTAVLELAESISPVFRVPGQTVLE
jgi:hypothetical protein